jgi:hypothetical protein
MVLVASKLGFVLASTLITMKRPTVQGLATSSAARTTAVVVETATHRMEVASANRPTSIQGLMMLVDGLCVTGEMAAGNHQEAGATATMGSVCVTWGIQGRSVNGRDAAIQKLSATGK